MRIVLVWIATAALAVALTESGWAGCPACARKSGCASCGAGGAADYSSAWPGQCGCCCQGLANRIAARRAAATSWHGDYYDVSYGAPLALVVPPTAGMQTNYHWGVAGTRVSPIYHQFGRGFPGYSSGPAVGFRPTPRWPSDTNQFGVYYVRGPW